MFFDYQTGNQFLDKVFDEAFLKIYILHVCDVAH